MPFGGAYFFIGETEFNELMNALGIIK